MMKADRAARTSHVVPARELIAFDLGAERVDIRGWPVFGNDARRVGVVDRLLIEQSTKRVRYVSVEVASTAADDAVPTNGGSVLVPIGVIRRFDRQRAVVLDSLTSRQVADAPRLHQRPITRADEDEALASYGLPTSAQVAGGDLYASASFDESRLGAGRPAV